MGRVGYPVAVKSRGKYFFYIRKSFRNEDGQPRNENIMSLGQKHKALALLEEWIADPKQKPDRMARYKEEDFRNWMEYIHGK